MGLMSYLRDRARRRRAYTDLLALDDRMLQDMGVTRSEVRALRAGRKHERG